MNEDEAIQNIHKKIEREKALINAANSMRSQTNNEAVRSRLDSQMRDGRRNLQFFEEKLRDIQMRKLNQGVEGVSLGSGDGDGSGPPPPPPKDASGGWGDRSSYGSGQGGQPGDLIPPRHPYAAPGPSSAMTKARPTYTKLGMHAIEWCFSSSFFSCLFFFDLVRRSVDANVGG